MCLLYQVLPEDSPVVYHCYFFSFLPQIINAVVLLILLSALYDPVQYGYHLTSSELGTDIDVMDDASKCHDFVLCLI